MSDAAKFNAVSTVFPCTNQNDWQETGLTKRELFAAMAMQGMLANSDLMEGLANIVPPTGDVRNDAAVIDKALGKKACAVADGLLEALEANNE